MHLISIKSVDTVVFCSNIDHIVKMIFDSDSGDKERLCIHLPINRIRDPFAKALRIDIARVENSLVKVLSCAHVIIVKVQNLSAARQDKFNSSSSKIQTGDKQKKNHNAENSRSERVSREKVDVHRASFLTHPFKQDFAFNC